MYEQKKRLLRLHWLAPLTPSELLQHTKHLAAPESSNVILQCRKSVLDGIVFVRKHSTEVAIERRKVKGPCSNNVPTCRANVRAKPLQGKDWQKMKVCWFIWVFMGFQGNCHVHVVSKTLIMHLFLLYYTKFFTTANKLEAEILIKVLQECCI